MTKEHKLWDERNIVAGNMQTYGGGFVQFLGKALGHADSINTEKVKIAFPEYWEEYLNFNK